MTIPLNKPPVVGRESEYIREVIASGHWHGDGPFTKRCQEFLRSRYGCQQVVLTHSCTAALEMAAILCDLKPGDEFILPSYTFVSTANAFVLRGGVPVWCDIRPDTLNIDESQIEGLITKRTKAIVPVHYGGVGCDMDVIMDIAARHDLIVVEDAAQAVEAFYRERPLGTIGHLGCFSFHATKNIVSGEGGALLINDERFAQRAEIIREKGTNRSQFIRGEVDKYTWVDVGSSYLPSEFTAAFLLAQLEAVSSTTQRRLQIWNAYDRAMEPFAAGGRVTLAAIPDHCQHNAHLYFMLLPSVEDRDSLLAAAKTEGIGATFHYVPLHSAPQGMRAGGPATLPVTDDCSSRLVRLPLYRDLSDRDVNRVVDVVGSLL